MQDWKLYCEVTQLDGRKFIVSLNNVKFVPEICSNLFRLNKALINGFTLSNDGAIVSLTKKYVTLTFDVVIKTVGDGCVTGVMMKTIVKKLFMTDMLILPLEWKGALTLIISIRYLGTVDWKL
jgi:hypothetical protein